MAISNHSSLLNGHAEANGYVNGFHVQNGHVEINGCTNGFQEQSNDVQNDEIKPYEPVAIIGCAMRLPGQISNSEALWDLLINKRDGRCRVPSGRYNVEAFHGDKPGCVASEYGYFLNHINPAEADATFWSMTAREIVEMDPQQRLALEVVYECLQNSGTIKWRGKNIGTYFGIFGEDWADMQAKENQHTGIYRITGHGDFVVANRVSYEFGFRGPSIVIRTACSSSLTALHEACMALHSRECESAIVGGSNMILNPHMTVAMTEQGVLSPDGKCKTFDASANGYARGEGIVAIHIKRLCDAIRDNDPIRAIIRSSCVNSDGQTSGLSHPSSESHEALIRRSHALAGFSDFSKTAMIECHGTGTQVGDPLEAVAVGNVFGDYGIYIGSIKPNVGHSEGASGVTSVIKMVLALERSQIPPNTNFDNPNPKIPFKTAKLKVPVELMPWPTNRAERVGVNSFGIGGANAHILLESSRSAGLVPRARTGQARYLSDLPCLLTFSANSSDALREVVQSHEAYLRSHPENLEDLSYTVNVRREPLPYRAYSVVSAGSISQPLKVSTFERANGKYQLVFVFTGQGGQWARMGASLLEGNPVFRRTIQALEFELSKCKPAPSWSLTNELLEPAESSRLDFAEFSQPCCAAIQIALVDLLKYWGLTPRAVVGHSSGEIAAAYASGALTKTQAIRVAYYRGQVTKEINLSVKGAMAAVGLGRREIESLLLPGVVIGCENSPNSVTLSGDEDQLMAMIQSIKAIHPEALIRKLRVGCAYHSHHMKTVASKYLATLLDIQAKVPQIPFYSSVTGRLIDERVTLDGLYWFRNLTSPVLFSPAVSALLKGISMPLLLEVGPHSALVGPLRQIFRHDTTKAKYAATLVRNEDAIFSLLSTVGNLFQHDIDVNFANLVPIGRTLTDLPTYPWQRSGHYWAESRLSMDWRCRQYPHHDILGSRVNETTGLNPTWRNLLQLDNVPWLRDHDISHDIVFPGAGYVAMAGEAIRQLTGSLDFTVRDVNLTNALVMQETKEIEVITTLKSARLTTSLDSIWFEWEVSSLQNGNWIKHAFGEVRQGTPYIETCPETRRLQRSVDSRKWYSVMKNFGLNYGTRFQGMKNITADIDEHRAVALIDNFIEKTESTYTQHPCTIDMVFQLFCVAASKGLSRLFNKLCVPSFIGELYIKPVVGEILVEANTTITSRGSFYGDATGITNGDTVFRLKNLRLSPLTDSTDARGDDPHAAAELVWKPHINFVDNATLIRPNRDYRHLFLLVERMALACIVESSRIIDTLVPVEEFFLKFRSWIFKVAMQASQGTYPNVMDCKEISCMTSRDRIQLIESIYETAKETEVWPLATAVYRVFNSCGEIFTGQADALTLLLENSVWSKLYDYERISDLSDFFILAAHYKPNLKILEIGAGSGGVTSSILPILKSKYGERMYFSYTYTDISAGFFVAAKDQFKDFEAIEYKVLDISKDPLDQGFEANSYDIIVASNVIHATSNITESLSNARKLIAPRGRLFLRELYPPTKWINYVMGTLSGWWLGEKEGRVDEPYLSPEKWEHYLRAAGFDGLHAVYHDQQFNANMIAIPKQPQLRPRKVTLLYDEMSTQTLNEIQAALRKQNYFVELCRLGKIPPERQDIVAVLDVERPFFHDVDEINFSRFKSLIAGVVDSGILWVTGAAQIHCKDPRYGLSLGMARTIRTEMELDFATLELECFNDAGWNAIVGVLSEFQLRSDSDEFKPTFEFALADGIIQIGRFHWKSINKELSSLSLSKPARKLDIGKRGFLSSLYWKQYSPAEPAKDFVQVKNYAIGLNFKDVLISMGIVEGQVIEGDGLGCESSGIIEGVGPNVQGLSPGDRVMVFGSGAFSTNLTTMEQLCVKIPDSLTFVDAASMPTVYGTVIYSLFDKARLEKGQSVLIHSACGGVGIAAIQICRMVGAEIFCTVGNDEKVSFLMREFNIPRDRIFDSRQLTFQRDVLSATNGRGVDVVLNSLSGELLHASWKCVAKFGCMIEIGKRDLIGKGTLALDVFEQNRTYFGVDFAQICMERPSIIARLLKQIVQLYEQGHIKPIHPITQFESSKIEDAMRFMQKGSHIGKIVVTMPESPETLPTKSEKPIFELHENASYLLVGGLGGLGQAIAVWMAEAGVKEVIFLSRSAGTPGKYDNFVQELKALGCSAIMVSGSVIDEKDVERAIKMATKPVRGVIQASMVLKDTNLVSMSFDDWQAAVAPKVQGTWNLHSVLLKTHQPVDFFLLLSSWSGLVGQWGQANYASANAFLDAFTQYRHSQNLPSATIDMGVMEDIGYVSRNPHVLDHFHMTCTHVLHEQDLLDSLQLLIARPTLPWNNRFSSIGRYEYVNKAQLALGLRSTRPLSTPNNRTVWKRDPRMAFYRNIESQAGTKIISSNEALKEFLKDASHNTSMLHGHDSITFLATEIGKTLYGFMLRDEDTLDLNLAPSASGVDSLVAIELRNWFKQSLGLDVTVLEILGSESLLTLGMRAIELLVVKYSNVGVNTDANGKHEGNEKYIRTKLP